MGEAFVYAEGYFRELKAREETLIKHLCRSGSDPASTWKNRSHEKKFLQGSWMLQREVVVHLLIWPWPKARNLTHWRTFHLFALATFNRRAVYFSELLLIGQGFCDGSQRKNTTGFCKSPCNWLRLLFSEKMFCFPGGWGLMKLSSCFHHKHTPAGFILNTFWLLSLQNPLQNETPAAGKGLFFTACEGTCLRTFKPNTTGGFQSFGELRGQQHDPRVWDGCPLISMKLLSALMEP